MPIPQMAHPSLFFHTKSSGDCLQETCANKVRFGTLSCSGMLRNSVVSKFVEHLVLPSHFFKSYSKNRSLSK